MHAEFAQGQAMHRSCAAGASQSSAGQEVSPVAGFSQVAQDYAILLDKRAALEEAAECPAKERSVDEVKGLRSHWVFECARPMSSLDVNASGLAAIASWDGTTFLYDLYNWCQVETLQCTAGTPSKQPCRMPTDSYLGVQNARSYAETAVVDVAFSPVKSHLLGLAKEHGIQLWGMNLQQDWECQAVLQHEARVTSIDFHAAQSIVAGASETGCLSLWDVQRQDLLRMLSCGTSRLVRCRFLGASKSYQFQAVCAGMDGLAHVWDLRRPAKLRCIQGPDAATCLDCHAGAHLLTASFVDGLVGIWDMRKWQVLQRWDLGRYFNAHSYPKSIALSPCGTLLAAGGLDGELMVVDLSSDSHATTKVAQQDHQHTDAVSAISWYERPHWDPPNLSNSQHYCLASSSLDGYWTCWDYQK